MAWQTMPNFAWLLFVKGSVEQSANPTISTIPRTLAEAVARITPEQVEDQRQSGAGTGAAQATLVPPVRRRRRFP